MTCIAPTNPQLIRSRDVVLVHGFLGSPGVFWRMRHGLRRRGWTPHALALRPRSGRWGLEAYAQQVQAYVDQTIAPDASFDLIGFSMGGLVARYYLQRLGGLARVGRLITLSTPHHGSRVAHLLGGRACVQMRPGSALLLDLNADVHVLQPLAPVSIWTPFDLTIVPATSAILPVGRNVRVPILQHTLMLWSRRVLTTVTDALEDRPAAGQQHGV